MEETDILRATGRLPEHGWIPGNEPRLHVILLESAACARSPDLSAEVPEDEYGMEGTRGILGAMGYRIERDKP